MCFFSRKLSPAERNYDIGNRELLTIKLALEEWRQLLEGAKHQFTVLTDYKHLEYLRQAKRLNPCQARWVLFFTHFNFSISYCPGPKNVKMDTLSRLYTPDEISDEPEPLLPKEMVLSPIQWSSDFVPSTNASTTASAGLSTRIAICHQSTAHSPHSLCTLATQGPIVPSHC